MKRYIKTLALLILVVFSTHAWGEVPPISISTLNMLKESFKTDQNNTVISGLSVDFATDMLANGATGTSLVQLTKFLGNSVENKNKELQWKLKKLPKTLEISNSIWGNKFKESFKTLLENTLNVSTNPLPQNTSTINAWISEKTHNKIPSVLNPEKTDPYDMYLVNTVYFKDNWTTEFYEGNTQSRIFYSLSGQNKNVQMMSLSTQILYAENDKLKSIKLPYKNGGYMTIYLPDEQIDFKKFISDLSLNELNLNYTTQKVILRLPKFKIDKEIDVKKLFQSLGMNEIFKDNNTDLTVMTEKNTTIKDIKQRAIIEVDEKGTTAAATTMIRLSRRGGSDGAKVFTVDRPFLFFVDQGDFIGVYTGEGK